MSEANDYLESHFKEVYKAETDWGARLDAQINLPTVIVTVFLGASAFYFEHPPEGKIGVFTILYYVSIVLYFCALISTIFCMVKSYAKYIYALVPSPARLSERTGELRTHYRNHYGDDDPAIEADVKKALQGELIVFYQKASDENRANNVTRTGWLFYTTSSIVAALTFLLISRVLYYTVDGPSKPQKVQVVSTQAEPSSIKVEAVALPDVQKVEITNSPKAHRVELTNPATEHRVEIINQPPVQKVEIIETKKEAK